MEESNLLSAWPKGWYGCRLVVADQITKREEKDTGERERERERGAGSNQENERSEGAGVDMDISSPTLSS